METFDSDRLRPLSEHDPRWQPLFGRVLVHPALEAAVGDPERGWLQDGGDDYAFRVEDIPLGSVEIVADGWWDGHGSFGALGAVQNTPPHRLYEAALWRGRLALIYFAGPGPADFELLAESRGSAVRRGFYRLVFCLDRRDAGWDLRAALQDPRRAYASVARAAALDDHLGPGGQGIGMLGGGGDRGPHITSIAVRDVTKTRPCSIDATP